MCARSCAAAGVADDASEDDESLASAASNTTLGTGFAGIPTKRNDVYDKGNVKFRVCLYFLITLPKKTQIYMQQGLTGNDYSIVIFCIYTTYWTQVSKEIVLRSSLE